MSCSVDGPEIEATHEDENQETLTIDKLSRRDIRSMIFHLLYAMESFEYDESLEAILDNFNRGFNMDLKQEGEVFKTTQEVIEKKDSIDESYKPLLANWRLERIGIPTKLILRLAVWELTETDMDSRIVINEAVELAKCFAEKDSFKFINGILDGAAKKYRSLENPEAAVLDGQQEDKDISKKSG